MNICFITTMIIMIMMCIRLIIDHICILIINVCIIIIRNTIIIIISSIPNVQTIIVITLIVFVLRSHLHEPCYVWVFWATTPN